MGMHMPPERLVWMLCSIPADEDSVSSSSVWSLWGAASSLFGGGGPPKRSEGIAFHMDPEGFGSGSSELQRIFKRYSASIHALSPMLKAVLCRHLASRAFLAGAQTHPLDEDEVLAELLHTTTAVGTGGGGVQRSGAAGLSPEKSVAGEVGKPGGLAGIGGKEALKIPPPPSTLTMLPHRVLPEVTVLANLFLSAAGAELTELKHWVDHPLDLTANRTLDVSSKERVEGGGQSPLSTANGNPPLSFNPSEIIAESYVDMVSVLSLMPPPLRAHILQHIRTEAIVAMSGSRSPLLSSSCAVTSSQISKPLSWPWPLKVYSDVDDTVQVRLYDCSFPRTTTYPGYVHLMRALRGQDPIHSHNKVIGGQDTLTYAPHSKSYLGSGEASAPSPTTTTSKARELALGALRDSFVDQSFISSDHSKQSQSRGNSLGVLVKEEVAAFAHAAWGTATRASRALQAAAEIAGELTGARGGGSLGGLGKVSRRPASFSSAQSYSREHKAVVLGARDLVPPSALILNSGKTTEGNFSQVQNVNKAGQALWNSATGTNFSLPRGDLVFLSARPSFMRASTLALASSIGLEGTAVLCGTLVAALTHTRMAGRKLSNHLIHASCYPEYRFMFVGDSGQADVAFALKMLAAHARLRDFAAEKSQGGPLFTPPTPLVLIHDIAGPDQAPITSTLKRAQLRARGVHVFDSYIDAAVLAFSEGLLGEDDLRVVVDGATEDLAGIEFDSAVGGGDVGGKPSSFNRGSLRGKAFGGGMGGGGGNDFSLQRLERLQEYQTAMMRAHIVLGKERPKHKCGGATITAENPFFFSDPGEKGLGEVLSDEAIEEALAKEDEEEDI